MVVILRAAWQVLGRARAGTHRAASWLAAVLFLGMAAAPLPAAPQARATLPRIGILSFDGAPSTTNPDPAQGFERGSCELGYVEGQNIVVERHYADGRPERLAPLAAELAQRKIDVILAAGPGPLADARRATRMTPIVTGSGSTRSGGWARSLARPGGKVTDLTVTFEELHGKRLELLKQAFPGVVRVAVLLDPAALGDVRAFEQAMQASARLLGLQIQVLEVRGASEVDAVFSLARQQRAQALFAIGTNTTVTHRVRIAALSTRGKPLSISSFPLMAPAGFLMTYGADLEDLARRAITVMDKILKGVRPGDLPIEQPTTIQLIVNLKTAKGLGITIPKSLLLRADEVIQ